MEPFSGAVRTACDIQVEDRRGPGGEGKLTWKKLTENGCCGEKLMTVDPQERSSWRSGVRSAMHAASQFTRTGGPLMWMMPLHLHVDQKSDYDMIMNKGSRDMEGTHILCL